MKKTLEIKLMKIFTYCQLLIDEIEHETIDENEMTEDVLLKTTALKNSLFTVVEQFYDSKNVSQGTLHLEIQKKIDYILNKSIK